MEGKHGTVITDSKDILHRLENRAKPIMKEVTAKPDNIVFHNFSDVLYDPYKVATESLFCIQNVSDAKKSFMKHDSARAGFPSQI